MSNDKECPECGGERTFERAIAGMGDVKCGLCKGTGRVPRAPRAPLADVLAETDITKLYSHMLDAGFKPPPMPPPPRSYSAPARRIMPLEQKRVMVDTLQKLCVELARFDDLSKSTWAKIGALATEALAAEDPLTFANRIDDELQSFVGRVQRNGYVFTMLTQTVSVLLALHGAQTIANASAADFDAAKNELDAGATVTAAEEDLAIRAISYIPTSALERTLETHKRGCNNPQCKIAAALEQRIAVELAPDAESIH